MALPVVPLLFLWDRWRPQAALRYSDLRSFATLSPGRAGRVQFLTRFLRSLAILSLIVALAGPRIPDRKTPVPAEGITIVIVLDMSGSMFTKSFEWEPGAEPISRGSGHQKGISTFR